jgi:hypothetical protein
MRGGGWVRDAAAGDPWRTYGADGETGDAEDVSAA